MKITGTFKINTHTVQEKTVFKAMKQFFEEQFQDYEFEVKGEETLTYNSGGEE